MGIYRDYPMVFYPAFKLQDRYRSNPNIVTFFTTNKHNNSCLKHASTQTSLMKATLGVENWKKLTAQFDINEKKIAGLLSKPPASFHARVAELNDWFLEEKASAMAEKSSRSQRGGLSGRRS